MFLFDVFFINIISKFLYMNCRLIVDWQLIVHQRYSTFFELLPCDSHELPNILQNWMTYSISNGMDFKVSEILSIQRLQRPPSPDTHILIHCSLVLCEAWVKQTVTVRPTDKPTSHYYQHTFTNKQRVHRQVSTALDCLKMSNLL